MDSPQPPAAVPAPVSDGRTRCSWFADRNLQLLTHRINLWLEEAGKPLEIHSLSHSVQIFDADTGNGLCTALVLWRVKKRKLKDKKKRQPPDQTSV
jgi:hypothetical protein